MEGGDGVEGDGILANSHGGGDDSLAMIVIADTHLHEQLLGLLSPFFLIIMRLGLGCRHGRGRQGLLSLRVLASWAWGSASVAEVGTRQWREQGVVVFLA